MPVNTFFGLFSLFALFWLAESGDCDGAAFVGVCASSVEVDAGDGGGDFWAAGGLEALAA
jgi:hypothetical protein